MKEAAFIQVDLDGLWAVRRCHGLRATPEQDDPVYSQALPALLDLFERLGIEATFFVIGIDARVTWKRRHLEAVVAAGHEIANHSMTHNMSLVRLDRGEMAREIIACAETIRDTIGVEPIGFRAPGYGYSEALLETLVELGYRYDSSLLPTPWGWLMRRISATGADYGNAAQWRAPLEPHRPSRVAFWEVPVTVSRWLRLPFHGGIGYLLGRGWVERNVRRSRFLNYVIHGMDLVDGKRWPVTDRRRGRWFYGGSRTERYEFISGICAGIKYRREVHRTDKWIAKCENH